VELRQQLTAAEEAQSQQKRQIVELKQQLAAARGGEDQHAAEMAALATQLAVAAQDLDVARDEGRRLQQQVQVGTMPQLAFCEAVSNPTALSMCTGCAPIIMMCRKQLKVMCDMMLLHAQEREAQCATSSRAYATASAGAEQFSAQLAAAQAAAAQAGREHRAALEALQVGLPVRCLTIQHTTAS
jgi:hypothetical protein